MKVRAKETKRPLRMIVANWKMHPDSVSEAKALFLASKKEAMRRKNVQTIIAAPFVYLAELHTRAVGARVSPIMLGAQDVSGEKGGTHTGEISAEMLAGVGVSHVIVGHSERRARGENDDIVAQKVSAALKKGLVVILCIGETARDTSGNYLSIIETQLRIAFATVPKAILKSVIIAYEPVWAISGGDGRGQTATSDDVHEMVIFIRKILTSMYTRPSAERVPILYGGSVGGENALVLMQQGMIDGFLVGGASLKPHLFGAILTATNEK